MLCTVSLPTEPILKETGFDQITQFFKKKTIQGRQNCTLRVKKTF